MLITYLDLMHTSDAPLCTLQHSANQSSPAFLHVLGVTTFTSNTVFFFQHGTGLMRCGNDAMIEMNASKKSATDFLYVAVCLALQQRKGCGYDM